MSRATIASSLRETAWLFGILTTGFVLSLVAVFGGLWLGMWVLQFVCELASWLINET